MSIMSRTSSVSSTSVYSSSSHMEVKIMSIQVIKVEDPDLLRQVYAFRYRIYVEQEAMTHEADHDSRLLKDKYDPYSVAYAVVRDGEVVASLRAIYLADLPDPRSLIEKFALT